MAVPIFYRSESLAEFAAEAANRVEIVFGRGVYVDENTSQAASVEFICHRRINYARSRLQELAEKAAGLFRQVLRALPNGSVLLRYLGTSPFALAWVNSKR